MHMRKIKLNILQEITSGLLFLFFFLRITSKRQFNEGLIILFHSGLFYDILQIIVYFLYTLIKNKISVTFKQNVFYIYFIHII